MSWKFIPTVSSASAQDWHIPTGTGYSSHCQHLFSPHLRPSLLPLLLAGVVLEVTNASRTNDEVSRAKESQEAVKGRRKEQM